MAQQSRACAALAGNWVQFSAPTRWLENTPGVSLRLPSDLQGHQAGHMGHMHACRQAKQSYTATRGKRGVGGTFAHPRGGVVKILLLTFLFETRDGPPW